MLPLAYGEIRINTNGYQDDPAVTTLTVSDYVFV